MEDYMRTEKPMMDISGMKLLTKISLAPYIYIATNLISNKRKAGGTAFRHQISTLGILIEYGYIDPILLKASVIHDTLEDLNGFDPSIIENCDEDGQEVLKLVLEVSKQADESKGDFLKRIVEKGSYRAKVLKCADRISNLIELGFVTDAKFIERTCEDSECYILPLALQVDFNMYLEILSLIESRKKYLEDIGYYNTPKK